MKNMFTKSLDKNPQIKYHIILSPQIGTNMKLKLRKKFDKRL